jgi:hypothetical protein
LGALVVACSSSADRDDELGEVSEPIIGGVLDHGDPAVGYMSAQSGNTGWGCGRITCQGDSGGPYRAQDCPGEAGLSRADLCADFFDRFLGGTCAPSCAGKQCGSDGRGGTCGSCAGGQTCDAGGQRAGGGSTCTPEAEPNDTSGTGDALGATLCGGLTSSDYVDWSTWSVSGAGVAYDLQLVASGDATLLMWKYVGGQWRSNATTSANRVARTANGSGTYAVAVYSPSRGATRQRLFANARVSGRAPGSLGA